MGNKTVPVVRAFFSSGRGILGLLLLVSGCFFTSAAELSVRLDSSAIPVGGYTYLNIEVEGESSADVETPQVDGLVFRRSGNSSNTSIINGRVTRSVTLRFTVLGEKAGEYTIPSIQVETDGQTLQTRALSIKVTDAPSSSSTRTYSSSSTDANDSDTLTAEDIEKIAFIRLKTSGDTIFVGQKLPLTVKLYLNTKMRFNQFNGLPSVENESILISPLDDQYERSVETVGNQRYEVVSWNTAFTAAKPGQTSLQSTLELSLLVRARRQSRNSINSIFDSDFFSPSYQSVPLLARSNELKLNILPFPDNQPDTFTGAIGDFQLNVSASPLQVSQGDPITLNIEISGSGNFDRVFHDGLPTNEQFKTYTPEETFTSDDAFSMSGAKIFKQAIIPIDPEETQIPSITYTFLNSRTGEFETLESPPIPIEIIPTSGASQTAANVASSTGKKREDISTDGLISFTVNLDEAHDSIRPWCTRSLFRQFLWATPVSLFLLSLGLSTVIRNKDHAQEKLLKERKRELRHIANELAKAHKSSDSAAFIHAAAEYTRTLLGFLWGTPAHAVTSADAKSRLSGSSPVLVKILSLNEAIGYAGGSLIDIDSEDLHQELKAEWQKLESELNLS